MRKDAKKSNLAKTETITVRLDPKLKYGLELLSRKHYRTVSSVVEWAVNNAIRDEFQNAQPIEDLWDVEASDRLVKLAIYYPELLNYEEQAIWKIIKETGYFWEYYKTSTGGWQWSCASLQKVRWNILRTYWDVVVGVANGNIERSRLPTMTEGNSYAADLEDDVPF